MIGFRSKILLANKTAPTKSKNFIILKMENSYRLFAMNRYALFFDELCIAFWFEIRSTFFPLQIMVMS